MQPFTVLIALTAALLPTEMSGLSVSLGESVSRNLKVRDDIGWKIPRFLAADDNGDDNGDDEYDDNGNDEGDDMGDDMGDDNGDDKGDDNGNDEGDDMGDDMGDDNGDEGDDKGDDAGGGGMQIYDWRDYSMQGLRCINWKKGVDVIVWSLYDDDYSNRRYCSVNEAYTMILKVEKFVDSLAEAYGYDYNDEILECKEDEDDGYYYKIGCNPCTNQDVTMVAYSDQYCRYPIEVSCDNDDIAYDINNEDYDDNGDDNDRKNVRKLSDNDNAWDMGGAGFALSTCFPCTDQNGEYDDDKELEYGEVVGENGICANLWQHSRTCDKDCQKIGLSKNDDWNGSEIFGMIMLIFVGIAFSYVILKKRQEMSAKDRLIEESVMMSQGVKTVHILGFGVFLFALVVFLAILKKVTMALSIAFIIDIILFVYVLKLTLFAGDSN